VIFEANVSGLMALPTARANQNSGVHGHQQDAPPAAGSTPRRRSSTHDESGRAGGVAVAAASSARCGDDRASLPNQGSRDHLAGHVCHEREGTGRPCRPVPGQDVVAAFPHSPTGRRVVARCVAANHRAGVHCRHRRAQDRGSCLPDATPTDQDLTGPGRAAHHSRVSRDSTVIPNRRVRLGAPAEPTPVTLSFNGRTP
jgi:hypothetical protein